jgi:hypothetical protein
VVLIILINTDVLSEIKDKIMLVNCPTAMLKRENQYQLHSFSGINLTNLFTFNLLSYFGTEIRIRFLKNFCTSSFDLFNGSHRMMRNCSEQTPSNETELVFTQVAGSTVCLSVRVRRSKQSVLS